MNNLTVAKRLALGFGLAFLLLLAAVALGLSRLDSVNDMMERVATQDWKKAVLANDAIDLMNGIGKSAFLLFHAADRKPLLERIEADRQAIAQKLDELEKLIYRPEGKQMLGEIRERRKAYVSSYTNVLGQIEAGRQNEASRIMASETAPALNALIDATNRLIVLQGRILEETGEAGKATYVASRNTLIGFLAVSALLFAALSVWIIRSVTRPLGGEPDEAKAAVERIAQGDLTAEIRVRAGDGTSLLSATRNMQAGLRRMVSELKANAEGVASAAGQLASSSGQVAAATAHQSEAASAMAAAVEQMTVSINHVS
ncbi:MAG: methyl-accepting chemotaxis protein, partial [Rhodocyclaceae bacterium]|nr:methyl-accepting chemotaxis protein [Rhodocyclaceae bacterium]